MTNTARVRCSRNTSMRDISAVSLDVASTNTMRRVTPSRRRAGRTGARMRRGGVSMAVKAFILIDTSPGKAREVAGRIRQVQGVSVAHAVTGPHDIIAIAEA